MAVGLGYIEPLHRLGLMDDSIRRSVVVARDEVRRAVAERPLDSVTCLDPGAVSKALTLEENFLLGTPDPEAADGSRRIREQIRTVLSEMGALSAVLAFGLEAGTGPAGRRLSLSQRQRLGLARALMRRTELLVVDRALSALGEKQQAAIANRVLTALAAVEGKPRPAVYWVFDGSEQAAMFDRMVVFRDGRIAQDVPTTELRAAQVSAGVTPRREADEHDCIRKENAL
jgi:putative ABC transport system ATP-binding protein